MGGAPVFKKKKEVRRDQTGKKKKEKKRKRQGVPGGGIFFFARAKNTRSGEALFHTWCWGCVDLVYSNQPPLP